MVFKEHPHIDIIPVQAEVEYPNVELGKSSIDFGYIVNETTKCMSLTLRNTSSLPVAYEWYLSDCSTLKNIGGTQPNTFVKVTRNIPKLAVLVSVGNPDTPLSRGALVSRLMLLLITSLARFLKLKPAA